MTKAELVKELAISGGVTQAAAEKVLEGVVEYIRFSVCNDGRCAIGSLGVFKRASRKASYRPNPQKPGEKVLVAAHNTVTFSPCPEFKGLANT